MGRLDAGSMPPPAAAAAALPCSDADMMDLRCMPAPLPPAALPT
jgi:hypothetical protein